MHLKNAFICMRINNKISGTLLATKGNATHYLIIYNHLIKKNAKSFLFHVKYLINLIASSKGKRAQNRCFIPYNYQ